MRFAHLFQDFTNSEKAGGIVLFACTIVSMLLANSSFSDGYISFWQQPLDLSIAAIHLNLTVIQWINDGLMTIFFLLVGLEIEREIYAGELRSMKNASLPIAGAIGGMLFPALIYYYFNKDTATVNGYGIPMATDIAFALGMLSLVGNRIPRSLKIFLTALAIIDDIGAIFVIAFFYNAGLDWLNFGITIGIFILLLTMNKLKVQKLIFYLIPGIVMWYFMHASGIHPSLSGILLAFAIPFGKHDEKNISYHLQSWLHKPVAFVILPLFALANTAIHLDSNWFNNLSNPNSTGIIAGLVIGKTAGILGFCWLLTKLRLGSLPSKVQWKHIAGAAMLGGIGFTMSIFIANIAFGEAEQIQISKVAVLIGSLIATLLGLAFLFVTNRNKSSLSD